MADNDNEKKPGDAGKDPRLLYADDEQENGVFRWMSALVILMAVAGFFGLAWYAYKSGGEAVDEKDVELVKADKSPVKEVPTNPGGMQIPNQDKTVYGLISENQGGKQAVERILPAPEEPMARDADTETWISDKAKNKASGEAGGEKVAEAVPPVTAVVPPPATQKAEQFNPGQLQNGQNEQASTMPPAASAKHADNSAPAAPLPAGAAPPPAVAAPKPAVIAEILTTPAPAIQAKKESSLEETETDKSDNEAPKPEAVAKPPAKGPRVQLGAYKSEAEAKSNWAKISKRFASETEHKDHYIIRADLGEKGIYYRLQVAPFASAKEAEAFCLTFVSADQSCFLAKAK